MQNLHMYFHLWRGRWYVSNMQHVSLEHNFECKSKSNLLSIAATRFFGETA